LEGALEFAAIPVSQRELGHSNEPALCPVREALLYGQVADEHHLATISRKKIQSQSAIKTGTLIMCGKECGTAVSSLVCQSPLRVKTHNICVRLFFCAKATLPCVNHSWALATLSARLALLSLSLSYLLAASAACTNTSFYFESMSPSLRDPSHDYSVPTVPKYPLREGCCAPF